MNHREQLCLQCDSANQHSTLEQHSTSINKEVLKAAPAGGRTSFALSGRGVNTLVLNEGLC